MTAPPAGRLVAFTADAAPVTALAGDVAELREGEQATVVSTALDAAERRPPVLVVGERGRSTAEALRFARAAAATELLALVQEAPGYLGAELGADGLAEVLHAAPKVVCVKVEGGSESPELLRARLGDGVPLWGGDGGGHLLEAACGGAVGSILGVELVDRLVEVWCDECAGERERAEDAFASLLPLLVSELESLRRCVAAAKYVLRRRGVLDLERVRVADVRLGDAAAAQLDRHLARALATERIAS